MNILHPPGWKRPTGYVNGIAARGTTVFVAGMIGWDENETFQTDDMVQQFRQCLLNSVAVLTEAGAKPDHVTRMTIYVTDREEYLRRRPELTPVWREVMGEHYPAMAMLVVSALLEPRALVECETTAVIPD